MIDFVLLECHIETAIMSTKIFFPTAGSEILQLARATSSKEKFQKLIASLLTRM